jgi:hypothetical protein
MNERVYVHECIAIEGGGRGRMIDLIRNRWAPHLARDHGVRLVGVWATVGSTAAWPEIRAHWEMDDWAHFARAQRGQYPMEERDVYLTELWNQALEYRHGGRSLLLRPAPFSPDLATIQAERITGDLIFHEDVRSLPGRGCQPALRLQSPGPPPQAHTAMPALCRQSPPAARCRRWQSSRRRRWGRSVEPRERRAG